MIDMKYTLCLVKRGDELLMLNRKKASNMGLWNGVGGKIEPGEWHRESAIRETFEETGILHNNPQHVGNVIWTSNRGDSGMYVYLFELPLEYELVTPIATAEGILHWQPITWLLDPLNQGITDNLRCYLPAVLAGETELDHVFDYVDGVMQSYEKRQLTAQGK